MASSSPLLRSPSPYDGCREIRFGSARPSGTTSPRPYWRRAAISSGTEVETMVTTSFETPLVRRLQIGLG